MRQFSLHLITYLKRDDAGQPIALAELQKTREEENNAEAIKSMLRKVNELKEINRHLPNLKIVARLVDDKNELVSIYED